MPGKLVNGKPTPILSAAAVGTDIGLAWSGGGATTGSGSGTIITGRPIVSTLGTLLFGQIS